jgi:hypothetical protein
MTLNVTPAKVRAATGNHSPKTPPVKSEFGPPATLGGTATAGVRIIVWCKACGHRTEPDVAAMVERYGAELSVLVWRNRLSCSRCGGRQIDMVLTGERW